MSKHCLQVCALRCKSFCLQIAKAEAGQEARFIDLHTTQHLEWHVSLLAELKAKAKKAGFKNPSDAMLRSMAQEIADGSPTASMRYAFLALCGNYLLNSFLEDTAHRPH